MVAAKWLYNQKETDDVFADKLNLFFEESGYWEQANTLISKFLSLAVQQKDWERAIIFGTRHAKFLSLQGNLSEEALEHLKEGVEIADDLGHEELLRNSLTSLGIILRKQDKLDYALTILRRVFKISEHLNDKRSMAIALNGLGGVLQKLGKLNEAKNAFQRQVKIAEDLNDKPQQAIALNGLGEVLQKLGKLDEALTTSLQQIVLCQTLNNPKDWKYVT